MSNIHVNSDHQGHRNKADKIDSCLEPPGQWPFSTWNICWITTSDAIHHASVCSHTATTCSSLHHDLGIYGGYRSLPLQRRTDSPTTPKMQTQTAQFSFSKMQRKEQNYNFSCFNFIDLWVCLFFFIFFHMLIYLFIWVNVLGVVVILMSLVDGCVTSCGLWVSHGHLFMVRTSSEVRVVVTRGLTLACRAV